VAFKCKVYRFYIKKKNKKGVRLDYNVSFLYSLFTVFKPNTTRFSNLHILTLFDFFFLFI